MPRPLSLVLSDAQRELDLYNQGQLGKLLGSSERTGQRWQRGQSTPMPSQLHKLAALVYPKNPALAAEVAAATGVSLEQLGIVAPPRPAPPAAAPPPSPDPAFLVDTVVCAAAEEMDMMPESIRPALRAAFRRARLAGLSVADVDRALHVGERPTEASGG